jgi:hypothetical protein
VIGAVTKACAAGQSPHEEKTQPSTMRAETRSMRDIYVNGIRVRALRCIVRNAYSSPHAYVLEDGSFLSQQQRSSGSSGERSDEVWVMQRKHDSAPVHVTVGHGERVKVRTWRARYWSRWATLR